MAKGKKQQPKKDDVSKQLRTEANARRRQAKHAKRVAKQSACPLRGKARAMRRWFEGVSREWPKVLTVTGYVPAQMIRAKPQRKEKEAAEPVLYLNGKPMGSMAEALFTVRELAAQRKAQQATAQG